MTQKPKDNRTIKEGYQPSRRHDDDVSSVRNGYQPTSQGDDVGELPTGDSSESSTD